MADPLQVPGKGENNGTQFASLQVIFYLGFQRFTVWFHFRFLLTFA